MRPARLTAALLIATAALSACSGNNITAPEQRPAAPSFNQEATCRGIYAIATGRCDAPPLEGARASVQGTALTAR